MQEACSRCQTNLAKGHDTVTGLSFCNTMCQAGHYVHALVGGSMIIDNAVIARALQRLGGDAELEAALARVEENRNDDTVAAFMQAVTRVVRSLNAEFATRDGADRWPLELFKDAIASYLDTHDVEESRAYMLGSTSKGETDAGVIRVPFEMLGLTNVSSVSCGDNHAAILTRDGHVYMFGNGLSGQLGGPTGIVTTPRKIPTISNAMVVSCGKEYTGIVTREGLVYTFGYNGNGQLGHGHSFIVQTPTLILGLPAVIDISCGRSHTGVVTRDGNVYTFGNNIHGQLGHETAIDRLSPVRLNELPEIISISCGAFHTGVVARDGHVFMFGLGDDGRLGDAGMLDAHDMSQHDGVLPFEVPGISDAMAISCGHSHTGILLRDGSVYMFGRGDKTSSTPWKIPNLPPIRAISCGINMTGLVSRDGYALGLGRFFHIYARVPELITGVSDVLSISCSGNQIGLVARKIVPRFPFNIE